MLDCSLRLFKFNSKGHINRKCLEGVTKSKQIYCQSWVCLKSGLNNPALSIIVKLKFIELAIKLYQ